METFIQIITYGLVFIACTILLLFFVYVSSRLMSHAVMKSIKENLKIDFGGNNVEKIEKGQ